MKKIGIPVTDIMMPKLSSYTSRYGEELNRSISESDMVILSHPYLSPEVKKYIGNKPYIYEAQDIEYMLKKYMLPNNETSEKLLKAVFDIEKECCQNSGFIMACSKDDKQKLSELYNIPLDKIIIVPNGVDADLVKFTNFESRKANKKKLGIENEKIVLFMGSWHQPNLEACKYIFKLAEKTPEIKYLLMGSQCLYFRNKKIPKNVGLLGVLDEDAKQAVLDAVDVALNPMMSGSGTNLKMFEYMAAGIPVITTEFGARGIGEKDFFILSSINEMDSDICKALYGHDLDMCKLTNSVRKYIEENFDWSKIANILIDKIQQL